MRSTKRTFAMSDGIQTFLVGVSIFYEVEWVPLFNFFFLASTLTKLVKLQKQLSNNLTHLLLHHVCTLPHKTMFEAEK